MYCIYLTVYGGDLMPHFYVGSTSIKNISKGYHGSVSSQEWKSIWKQELKDHPELFVTLIIHHLHNETRNEALELEKQWQKVFDAVTCNMFSNRAYATGQFFNSGHSEKTKTKIGKGHKGTTHSDEAKAKMSLAKKGKPSGRNGYTHSAETRAKMSVSQKSYTRIGPWHLR